MQKQKSGLKGRGGPGRGQGRKKGNTDIASPEARRHVAGLARAHAEEAINTLVSLMRSAESEQVRYNSAVALLDRGFGKVPQAMDLGGGTDDNTANDSFAQVAQLLNALASKRAPKESDK